jgi:hypothetical protein
MAGQELYLQITLDENGSVATVNNLGQAIAKAGGESKDASGKVDKLTDSVHKSDSSTAGFISTLKGLGITYAALKIERMVEGWVKMSIAQDQADRTLKAAMIANGRYSEAFYQSTLKQAQALQLLTGEDDAVIEASQRMLMTFGAISNDAMPRATKAVLNLAVLMGSEGGGLRGATVALGKAMDGGTEGLRRYGIVIDENVYKQRGAAGVLEEVEKKVGGQADALAKGSGQWKLLGAALGEAKESLGKFFNTIADRLGILESLIWDIDKLRKALDWINDKSSDKPSLVKDLSDLKELVKKMRKESIPEIGSFSYMFFDFDERLLQKQSDAIDRFYQKKSTQILNKIASTATIVEEIINSTKSLDQLSEESMGKIMEGAGSNKIKELADDGKEAARSLKAINDIIAKHTLDPYQLAVYELDKTFQAFDETIRNSPAGIRAYGLALDDLKEKFRSLPKEFPVFDWGLSEGARKEVYDQAFGKKGWFGGQPQTGGSGLGFTGFSTSLTPTPSTAQTDAWLKESAEALAKRDTAAYEKAQAKIKAAQDEIKARWDSMAASMGSSFTDALVGSIMGEKDAFKNMGKHILDMFLTGWVDRLITQSFINPIINSMSGLFAQGQGVTGGSASSSTSWLPALWQTLGQYKSQNGKYNQDYLGADITMAAGAGVAGYQSGGWAGGIGSAVGYGVGGSFGAVAGGAIGKWFTDAMEKTEPPTASFNLLWEVVDGKVKNVADTWSNMTKNDEVFNSAQEFVQSTTDFFKKLSVVTGNASLEMPNWTFSMEGVGEDIQRVLNQSTTQAVMKASFGSLGKLSETFGQGFQEEMKKVFMDTMSQNLGMYVFGQRQDTFKNYLDWKFNQISSLPSEQSMSAFTEFMNSQAIFSPIGRPGIQSNSIFDLFMSRNPSTDLSGGGNSDLFAQLEQFAKQVTPGWFNTGEIALSSEGSQAPWKEFFTDLNEQVTKIFDMVTTGMGQAFADSLDTGEFATFEQKFKQSIMSTVQQSLIESFANQELIPTIFAPLYGGENHPAITEVLKQYGAGDIDFGKTQDYLGSIFTDLNASLKEFEPVWDILNTGFQSLTQALGLNTDATAGNTTSTQSNTDAILGPVNSFLMSLDTGSLAPSQSIAGLMGAQSKLYTSAFADPESFSEYASYMTGTYLPAMQGLSGDYEGVVSGVKSQVNALPWYNQSASPKATDIGAAVAAAVAPMLLDLKESAQITINISIDGKDIKTAVVSSLDDPSVVNKLGSRLGNSVKNQTYISGY